MKDEIKNAYRWIERNPSGIIVTFLFNLVIVYIVLWQIIEPINIPDIFLSISNYRFYWYLNATIMISLFLTLILEFIFRRVLWRIYAISYQCHNERIGWTEWKNDGELAGSENPGLRMEAIRIKLGHKIPAEINIEYNTHISQIGWLPNYSRNGEISGTVGQFRRLEAIKIRLINQPNNYSVIYRVRIAGSTAWSQWFSDDEEAGTTGQSMAIEAIRVLILKG